MPQTDDEGFTPIGLYNCAVSYHAAARALAESEVRSWMPDMPVASLYFHAVELYLKALLLFKGISAKELKSIGHNLKRLARKAHDFGLPFDEADLDAIGLIPPQEVIRVRYHRSRVGNRLPVLAFELTCRSLQETVGAELRSSGIRIAKPRVQKPLVSR
jgi:HEPN domain-containing protein